jgi:hypothetical protein
MALIAPDGFNHWISNRDFTFAWWWWYFDSDRLPAREQVLRVARVYETAAEQTGILRPMIKGESGEFIPLKDATGLSFCEHLEQGLSQLDATGKTEKTPLIFYPSRIAFYDENADIVEQYIDDLEPLLMRLRPDKADKHYIVRHYMHPYPAVGDSYQCMLLTLLRYGQRKRFRTYKSQPPGRRAYIGFRLQSDIWFGKVWGFMEDRDNYDVWYDNLDLAERHTPRLNQFLQAIHDVFQEIEGQRDMDTSESLILYRPLISETGITLD